MRKNTKEVFNAWFEGRASRKQNSVWTDGVMIYSYNVPILWNDADGHLTFNATKYSRTTSNHQNSLRSLCLQKHIEYINISSN